MESQHPSGAVVRGPGEGAATWAMGSLFERLASGQETGGAFDLTLATQPPGIAPPLHIHTREAEAFRITGTTPARFLSFEAPAGLMDLYDEVGMPAAERRLPGPDGLSLGDEIPRWNEIGPRYGLQVVGPPIPADR